MRPTYRGYPLESVSVHGNDMRRRVSAEFLVCETGSCDRPPRCVYAVVQ